jgi:hypothetical protein
LVLLVGWKEPGGVFPLVENGLSEMATLFSIFVVVNSLALLSTSKDDRRELTPFDEKLIRALGEPFEGNLAA